ncbi:MAG: CCA tRNA nucleotidyltransferase [Candidatus Omnitrophica bacterium]|nr:CCA tRNA nucleotidyltransferase [Candidatus Omnitrophota bacterium]
MPYKSKAITLRVGKALPGSMFKILKLAGDIADKKKLKAFIVGGFVRDVLLGVKNFDVDIVLEGKGLLFAKTLAKELSGSLVVYERFGTATVVTGLKLKAKKGSLKDKEKKIKIDIATARKEYYEYPAALPRVSFSSIRQDLYRRDFTINAMAVSLHKKTFGSLIDFFNGQRDLKAKRIRVLHDMSFVEDPTRIFRAIRFEQRYNFTIEPHTEELIKTAMNLNMFGKTQKQRLRNEIVLILSEESPVKALMRMHQLHELRFIHPRLKLTKGMIRLFHSIDETCSWYKLSMPKKIAIDSWIIYFMAMLDDIRLPQVKNICEKFIFTKGDEKRLISCKRYAEKVIKALKQRNSLRPSQIYKLLEPLAYEVILFIMAKSKSQIAKERILLFFKRYNGVRVSIGGKDLKRLGVVPGPRYKRILNRVLYDKLDGKIAGKKKELELAERLNR